MRFFCLLIFLLAVSFTPCLAQGFIEIDLNRKEIKLNDFHFGKYDVFANLCFEVNRKDGSLIFNIEGDNILFKSREPRGDNWLARRNFSWLKMRMLLRDNTLFINYLHSPEFLVKGKVDLAGQNLLLDIDGAWQEKSFFLEGDVKASFRVWGKFNDYMTSGVFDVTNGIYQDIEFSRCCVNFLGKPPLFNLTDSEITLKDGGVYKIEGTMDIRNFSNLFPKAEYVSKKVAVDGWQLLSERERSVGLKKNVDNNFDVVLDTYGREEDPTRTGTEVRYKVKGNQFLRLRMQDDKTIIGFEKRKEF